MKYTFFFLPAAIIAASNAAVAADTTEDRIAKLENEISLLKSQNESNAADKIRFNGFFSVGATSASNSLGYVDSNNRVDFEELTKLGLQASFDISDNTSVTTQVLAQGKGDNDFGADIEWAYVSHTFDNGSTVRAGKLRIPLFMYSDFLDVGLAQPWVRPPQEVYGAPITSYLGLDYSQTIDLEDSSLNIQLYGGEAAFKAYGQSINVPVAMGVVTTWTNDIVTLRGTFLKVNSINDTDDGSEFYGIGASYDNGELLLIGEYTEVDSDDVNSPNQASAYVTAGYRFDNWLPYVTLAKIESKEDERVGMFTAFNQQLDSYSLGTKYNISSNTSIKVDATHVTNFGDTTGVVLKNSDKAYDSSTVYSVRLDTVF